MATGPVLLQQVVLAFALGALVGLERERARGKKYAGLRTLSLFCGAGPLSVFIAERASSILPVAIYLLLGATFSLVVLHLRIRSDQQELGLTTSSTVFLIGLVGILIGYGEHFVAVAITLIAVFLLAEKQTLHRYANMMSPDEISDAVALGILALVLYPILPEGAVDPYGVLFLRKALLFVIFILLIQFAAFVALKWLKTRVSFLASAALGGVVSSLAVVSTMAALMADREMEDAAVAGALTATAAMILRNGFIAAVIAPPTVPHLVLPFGAAAGIGLLAVAVFWRRTDRTVDAEYGESSPFSFLTAFRFGILFLAILLVAEVAKTELSILGVYGTAFIGGAASSTAVAASAAALLASGSVTAPQAATMIGLGAASSLLSKLLYTEWGGARDLTRQILVPYLLMTAAVLLVLL